MPIRVKGPTGDRHPRRPWDSPERRKERQQQYMEKHGEPGPRRKRLATTDKFKEVREKLKDRGGFKPLRAAKATGGQVDRRPKGGPTPRPLPSPGRPDKPKKWELPKWDRPSRKIPKHLRDRLKDWKPRKMPKFPKPESKVSPGRPGGKGKESPDKRWNKGDKFMTPLRAKKGIGGKIIQKIITKIKPKQKPKNVDKLLKNLGDEIKAAPLPPQLKKLVKEKRLSKAFPHHDSAGKLKKASGGRIGLKKGSVHKPGSHSWYLQHMTRPKRTKKAEGGRIGYYGGGRTRLLEELGRVEAEPSNRNRRAEISRVHRELNKGYKSGGAVLKGKKVGIQIK